MNYVRQYESEEGLINYQFKVNNSRRLFVECELICFRRLFAVTRLMEIRTLDVSFQSDSTVKYFVWKAE